LPSPHWKSICEDCAGSIDSLVELLQGRLSKGRDGAHQPAADRAFPVAQRDQAVVQLPGLGGDVQACRGCSLWRRRSPGPAARAALPASRCERKGTDRQRRQVSAEREEKPGPAKVLGEEDLSKLFGLEIAEPESPAKAVRAKSAADTKSKPVDSKTKPPQKTANSKITKKSAAQTETTAKKKPVAASAKTKSDKAAALKKAAGKPTAKRANSARKTGVGNATVKASTNKSSAKRPSQTVPVAIQRRGSGMRTTQL
jgi:outer membrane biosynthesis protein TonB